MYGQKGALWRVLFGVATLLITVDGLDHGDEGRDYGWYVVFILNRRGSIATAG
jgi:hypothetical protein